MDKRYLQIMLKDNKILRYFIYYISDNKSLTSVCNIFLIISSDIGIYQRTMNMQRHTCIVLCSQSIAILAFSLILFSLIQDYGREKPLENQGLIFTYFFKNSALKVQVPR